MRRLPVLCPQEYHGTQMRVTVCNRCPTGWDREKKRCTIDTGAEHFPNAVVVPDCPIADRCQHNLQGTICDVRRAGFVCESALTFSGMSALEAADHPDSFHSLMMSE